MYPTILVNLQLACLPLTMTKLRTRCGALINYFSKIYVAIVPSSIARDIFTTRTRTNWLGRPQTGQADFDRPALIAHYFRDPASKFAIIYSDSPRHDFRPLPPSLASQPIIQNMSKSSRISRPSLLNMRPTLTTTMDRQSGSRNN